MNRLTAESLWTRASIAPGQSRGENRIMSQAGWFDQRGSRIGNGDLGRDDFIVLARVLGDTEFFFALDSEKGRPDQCIESIDYVIEHARFMVSRFQLYYLGSARTLSVTIGGVEFQVISRDCARKILAESKFTFV